MALPATIQGMKRSHVPIEKVRLCVLYLEEVYGGLREASEATGINLRTLMGIRQVGKHQAVLRTTAEAVLQATLICKRPRSSILDGAFENDTPRRFAIEEERRLTKKAG